VSSFETDGLAASTAISRERPTCLKAPSELQRTPAQNRKHGDDEQQAVQMRGLVNLQSSALSNGRSPRRAKRCTSASVRPEAKSDAHVETDTPSRGTGSETSELRPQS
jgi:hypothetical protein